MAFVNHGLVVSLGVPMKICQDEDVDSKMESPCSCSGSLKYAHRKCVQRWCNEKGDTMCEICHQQFKPGYTAPPPIFRFGGLPMNLRGNWQISRRDPNNPRIIAMVSTDHSFIDQDYDEYAVSTSRSIVCCRSVAIIVTPLCTCVISITAIHQLVLIISSTSLQFMVLLILRHTLPVIVTRAGNYSFPLIMLLVLRIIGIILPICIILKAVTSILRRQHQQANLSASTSDEESSSSSSHQQQAVATQ
ncbi:UNVERIFIED_CONTAM: hypothetical protein Scaly_0950300 [Sesamum calycinum]|uniref:RING-CH-type domain-containing protein n=1 Tax=Sesamum calycinum TaxID=2727403 RepID=A0AAW2QXP3_9LAMI